MNNPLASAEITTMKRFDFKSIQANRKKARVYQAAFWASYGVTQSGGSRYESGRDIPTPTAMLIHLHQTGVIDDAQLEAAREAVAKR